MIKKIYTFKGLGFNPYENLAVEEELLNHVPQNSCILYLWQNQKTVVIGKNQNAWKECRVKELERDGGFLARRLSGGGAVFHDLGNLNFTFIMNTEDYDLEKQLEVILKAVESLGIKAQKSGRNDIITEDGKKFSGNAFYHNGGKSYHHGTLMIKVDKETVQKYLNVSKLKLESKGVNSVKSRIINLSELNPKVNVENMTEALIKAFEEIYENKAEEFLLSEESKNEILSFKERNESFEWRLGRKITFDWRGEERFSWGCFDIELKVESGKIKESAVYSDAMDGDFLSEIPSSINGQIFSAKALKKAIAPLAEKESDDFRRKMLFDIMDYMDNQDF